MSDQPKCSTTYKGHPGQIEEVEAEKAEKMAKKVELEAQKQEAIARRAAGVNSSEQGLSEPINNYGDESEEGGDKDYVNNQSGEDGENSVDEAVAPFLKERAAKKKKEKKPVKERGALRGVINSTHKTPAVSANNPSHQNGEKKHKVAGQTTETIGGLKTNWKDLLKPNNKPKLNPKTQTVNAPSHESSPDSSKDGNLDFDREFTDEENLTMVRAVWASKDQHKLGRSQAVTVKADVWGTAKMGIKLQQVQAETTPSTKRGEPKPRYKNSDLPFEDYSHDLKIWRTKVIPAIIDWGGSRADPFAVVAHPKFRAVVEHFWDQSFSTVEAMDAVHAVASSAVMNWQSDIDKCALSNLGSMFKEEPFKSNPDIIQAYVEKSLKDMNFVYRDMETKTGSFRSDMMMSLFTGHLKTILKWGGNGHGMPIGALVLCAAAVSTSSLVGMI
ncbi:hypothetical protein L208DRAFT_1374635 [Tricholoma matsutake]|nr:hypothetical protein L208DRAFT_1374635 [Tricholoma matsutake 945]